MVSTILCQKIQDNRCFLNVFMPIQLDFQGQKLHVVIPMMTIFTVFAQLNYFCFVAKLDTIRCVKKIIHINFGKKWSSVVLVGNTLTSFHIL